MHHYFFLKFLTKKSWCVLWAGKYGNYMLSIKTFKVKSLLENRE